MNNSIFNLNLQDGRLSGYLMKFKAAMIAALIIFSAGFKATAQPGSGETVNCPAACPGLCWFVIDIVKTTPNAQGCFDASMNMLFGTTNPSCKADIDRVIGNGSIDYTLCDGTKCNLSDKNFPDGNPRPYPPGTPVPPGKVALSKPCYDAIKISVAGGGVGGGTYKFTNIKDITADFTMKIFCFCNNDTIRDTIPYKYNVAVVTPPGDDDGTGDGTGNGVDDRGDGIRGAIKEATTIHNTTGYEIESIYPNPIGQSFNVRLTLDRAEQLQFTIVTAEGGWLQNDIIDLPEGRNDIPIKMREALVPGRVYYLLIHRESGDFSTTRLIAK